MAIKLILFAIILCHCHADKDDKKWVWGENNRNANGRSYTSGLVLKNPNTRYNVYEETDDYFPNGSNQYYPSNNRPLIGNNPRPLIYEPRPPISGTGFIPEERPGGIYSGSNSYRPTYGGPHNQNYPDVESSIGLSGASWHKEGGPFKQFDKCKCTEKFNCNSPGVSYGHCDVGKQYCCYATKGEPTSSRPVHSIENGVLVGPGGPIDPISGFSGGNKFPRPPKQLGGGGFYRPSSGFQGGQYGSRPVGGYSGLSEPNEYSAANGILVGPGGPFDQHGFGIGRSAKTSIDAKSAKN
ncbi:uncharacterized protein LOC126738757 [Anthonomus grandis grandis]|uniref:uncharacterized protein LOC126738757 n=1 Tax=Anthonomus grandis grandis TaxID=2921223 RepID=UPI002165C7C9|nr:uncharacterized protein LOC126738757 [Anthonomus grandis grandis]